MHFNNASEMIEYLTNRKLKNDYPIREIYLKGCKETIDMTCSSCGCEAEFKDSAYVYCNSIKFFKYKIPNLFAKNKRKFLCRGCRIFNSMFYNFINCRYCLLCRVFCRCYKSECHCSVKLQQTAILPRRECSMWKGPDETIYVDICFECRTIYRLHNIKM
jgi:hypothetical protein